MEVRSPHSPHKAIKRALIYFENKVNNSNIKEQPASRKDPAELEVGVATVFGEIFWFKLFAKRNIDKTSTINIKSSPGTWHMFLSAIVLLMSGPFLYLALNSMNPFVFIVAGFFALIGIASILMPFFRIRATKKQLTQILISFDELISEKEAEAKDKVISRIQ
ncbi:MAG: hypothetical protein FK730_06880 [Asgard group archaeon]|nr:hypothetical protein [Asgard group archaeon]